MTETFPPPPPRAPEFQFEEDQFRRLTDKAAEKIGAAAAYFRTSNPEDLLRDATALLRRRPVECLAAAAVLGLIAGRLLFHSDAHDSD
jgi:hypothetical protein